MNPQGMSFIKLLLISAVAVTLGLGCEKKPEETDEESETPAVTINNGSSASYYSSCSALGSPMLGATHTKTMYLMNAGGTANAYQLVKYFYSDAGCTTGVYSITSDGAFSIGTDLSSAGLTNGYAIAFQSAVMYIYLYTNAASTAVKNGCPSWYPNDQGAGLYQVSGNPAGCGNMNMLGSGTTYNSIVIDGSNTLTLGTPDGDNPGVTNINNVTLTQTISVTK